MIKIIRKEKNLWNWQTFRRSPLHALRNLLLRENLFFFLLNGFIFVRDKTTSKLQENTNKLETDDKAIKLFIYELDKFY